mmetsp:Transcript_21558/g.59867  ORF Transcript_21558/g.59867 Transcript_21558/m.59867 type:complete len:91 (-) Transcript_21558:467-739(-)
MTPNTNSNANRNTNPFQHPKGELLFCFQEQNSIDTYALLLGVGGGGFRSSTGSVEEAAELDAELEFEAEFEAFDSFSSRAAASSMLESNP